jgi:hypothetical protein
MMRSAATAVRATDPETSLEAAEESQPNWGHTREAVLSVIWRLEPVTLNRLVAMYSTLLPYEPAASDSSIRTRCSELVHEGYVEQVPGEYGQSKTGRKAALWRLTDKGRSVFERSVLGV